MPKLAKVVFNTFLPAVVARQQQKLTAKPSSSHDKSSSDDQVSRQSISSSPLELTTISIEDFFNEVFDGQSMNSFVEDKLTLNMSEVEVERACLETMKVMFSPICSQLTGKSEVMIPKDYEFVGRELMKTVKKAFGSFGSAVDCDSIWKRIYDESFPEYGSGVDHALYNLYLRKEMIDSARNYKFSPENFTSIKDYNLWRDAEKISVESLINKGKEYRQNPLTIKLGIKIGLLQLDSRDKNTLDVFLKISVSNDKEFKEITTKPIRCTLNKARTMYIAMYDIDLLSIVSNDRNKDVVVRVFKKGLITSDCFGEAFISTMELISQLEPEYCSWALQPYESDIDVFEVVKSQRGTSKIGKINMKIDVQMERYPILRSRYTLREEDLEGKTDFHRLYDILVHLMIKSNNMEDGNVRLNLTTYQTWLIEEFCNQHGISELYKRLVLLREVVQRNDLLLRCVDEFKESLDFVATTIQQKFITATLLEVHLLRDIKSELINKLEVIISMFMNVLDSEKRRVFKLLIVLLEYVYIHDKTLTKEQFEIKLSDLVLKAVESDYESMKKELSTGDKSGEITASSLIKLVQVLRDKVEDIFFYSSALPDYCNFEVRSLKIYCNRLNADCEKVLNSTGFSGYQMLLFCSKLKELNDQILEYFEQEDLVTNKIQLLVPEEINRGYEDKYIVELTSKMNEYMQRSVALDKWQTVNEDVLHSTSLVDFFTYAFQTLDFISKLDFVTVVLLNKFEVAVGEAVVNYSRLLQELAVQDLMNQDEGVEDKIQTRCILNTVGLCKLFKMKEEVDAVNITAEFIVKLNNIAAARDQYKQLIEAFSEEKVTFSNNDSDPDSDESESDEEEQNDESSMKFRDTLYEISLIEQDLIILIATQFEPFIRHTLSDILQTLRKELKPADSKLSQEQIAQMYGKKMTVLLESTLLQPAITPNLTVLSEYIYNAAFLRVLTQIFAIILRECANFMLPSAAFGSSGEVLDNSQIAILKHLVGYCESYFYGSGEGISKGTIAREKRFIERVFQLYELDTPSLIQTYEQSIEKDTGKKLKSYHILAVLNSRIKYDKLASDFFVKNKDKALELYLMNEFGLEQSDSTSGKFLIQTSHCGNERLVRGNYFLTQEYFLWRPMVLVRTPDPTLTQLRSGLDFSTGKFKIHLKDIQAMRPLDPWITKGIKIKITGVRRIKVLLGTRPLRDQLLKAIAEQAKKLGNTVTILDAKKRSIARSISKTHKVFRGLPPLADASSSPATSKAPKRSTGMSWIEAEKQLQARFQIPDAKILERFTCSLITTESREARGTLYIFDTCFCFDILGNIGMESSNLVLSWRGVISAAVSKEDNEMLILLDDGSEIKIVSFLSATKVVQESINNAISNFRTNNESLINLKSTNIFGYYSLRFKIANDKLLKVINCYNTDSNGFRVKGTLFIGENHLCFENENNQDQVTIIPMSQIQRVSKNRWLLAGENCLTIVQNNGSQATRFVFREGLFPTYILIQRQVRSIWNKLPQINSLLPDIL